MNRFLTLFIEKKRLLQDYLQCLNSYRDRMSPDHPGYSSITPEQKLDWVDDLTSERESKFKMLQVLDSQINEERGSLSQKDLDQLKQQQDFREAIQQIIDLATEIQLTDQSLFLYINHIGFEIRSQILRGLKEKEAIKKFKSQGQTPSGEGLDQKV